MKYQRILKGDEVLDIPETLPVIPVRDQVIFPYSVVPLLIGRDKSLNALSAAYEFDNLILLSSQKNADQEEIKASDIYRIGTVGKILQVLDLPEGLMKVVVEGIIRARIRRFRRNAFYFLADIEVYDEEEDFPATARDQLKQLFLYFEEYVKLVPDLPSEISDHLRQQGDPYRMIDFVALHLQTDIAEKQKILKETDVFRRLRRLIVLLQRLISYEKVRAEIDQQVQENLLKNQRDYYLQEKLRIINQELGEEEEESPEIKKLERLIRKARMPRQAQAKALEELEKLRKIPPYSPEYTVIRNYLDWMVQVPWSKRTRDETDIVRAQKILDEDHYGLKKPKERIVEHLAVLQRVKKIKGPILCLVGPPGVGKTSLGKSVARALGRKFVRVSLGGVRDEAEIRGHRRTYIGSLPGKIIQHMKRAGTINPVFLLDEVDKMSLDFRGDPSAALLEVLDPEQNKAFNDHYLDVDYDLSEVFFITTANVQADIPHPLQDRMEIIELPGYLEHEKVEIARRHLIPRQLKEAGLKKQELQITREAVQRMIREYTREAGVRNLERQIATLCRKCVRKLAEDPRLKRVVIHQDNLEEFLGKPLYLSRQFSQKEEVGVATGLAWTAYGGDVLRIEVTIFPGKGQLILTGKLGEVMRESAQTAVSFIRSIASDLNISREDFEKNDVHVHIPEGAIPKDGPSAGITIATAVLSAFSRRPVRNSVALTGEITLRGKILAVGGLNEKLLAAQRNGIPTVIVPRENKKEIDELPGEIQEGLTILQVQDYREVMERVLVDKGG